MKLLAVNGSPRKKWNTGQLLEKVVEGAQAKGIEAELVQLRDLRFTGCVSCFLCKDPKGKHYGRCAVRDDLETVLGRAHEADVLVLGTPVYFGAESAFMRAFMERLWFQYFLYSDVKPPLSPRKKATGLIYTMNVAEDTMAEFAYDKLMRHKKGLMEHLFGPCETLVSCDTMQFDDYGKFDTDMWDAAAKRRRHDEVFPQELKKAFELGGRLVE